MNNCHITELPNGIRVITERIDHVKSFSLGFWLNVGSRDENNANNGISHFLEHMLFKGTKTRSAKKIAEEIESLGGYLNAFTSKEHTCFYGRGLSKNIDKTFEVLADMVQNSVFKTAEIEKESTVVIDELYDIEDSPEELIFDKFESNLFEGNPIALPIIGTEKNLRKFSRADIFDYINKNYTFNKLYIVASGAVHDKIVKLAKKYVTKDLGHSPERKTGIIIKPVNDLHVYKDIQQVHLLIGGITCGFDSHERTAINVLSHILGEGSSSRLFQSIREKEGIAYQINSFLNSFYDVSTFGVYLSTNDKSIHKAQSLIAEEFRKIKSRKVSDRELQKAKEFLIGSIIMSIEGTTNRMMRIAQSMIYFNKIKKVEDTVKEIEKVTPEKIREVANQVLDEKMLNRVIISSKNLLLHSAA